MAVRSTAKRTSDKTATKLGIVDLRCEYLINPLGLGEPRPRLSWKLQVPADARGIAQSAYRIEAATSLEKLQSNASDLWDSGKVASAQNVFVDYAGTPPPPSIGSGQRVWWRVRIWDQNGNPTDPSEIAYWEMGLLDRSDWKAQWIGSSLVGSPKAETTIPFFRKSFQIPTSKKIVSARLYATAMGFYEFRLNGQKVGDQVFAPFWTDYRKRVQYQVFDVTNLLKSGKENVAGIILGDGWYCGYTGNIGRRQFYGDRPKAFAQIVLRYSDGESEMIVTDDTWTTAAGPIISSDLMMGESYDARLEMPGWDAPGFREDNRWSKALLFEETGVQLVAMCGPPIRAIKEIKPISVKKILQPWDSYVLLFDFGQNLVGRVRLKVKGPAGTTITMRHAEILDSDGKIYTTNLRNAKQTDHYTLKGDPNGEIFESRFTFHGFRYVEIPSYPGDVPEDALTAVVLHSDMQHSGSFECSEPLVNQLQHNIEWGQRGNFLDVPTDCPQRDERLGWTGDAQVFVRTAAFNFDVSGFFAKWTQDLRDAQGPLGGYPSYAPMNAVPRVKDGAEDNKGDGGPAWADAGVICPWTMLQCYGDLRLISQHYDSMCRFMDRMVETCDKFGMIRAHPEWNGWLGFGDWLSQDGKDGLFGSTPKDLIGTAFLAYDAKLMASMANMLQKKRDVARFTKLATQASDAFLRRYVTADGLIVGNTQTAYVLALHFDLLPEKLRPAAIDALVRNIHANKNRLNTGFVGSPYLNHVLTQAGRLDVAYELLMQKDWPSWLYPVTHGATTIWERWDGWTHDKGFQNPGMNSFNHYAYGAVGAWLYQIVAGINVDPTKPGYEHIILRPHPLPNGPLTWAKASLETIRGRIESSWKLEKNGRFRYEVLIPPNTTATVALPTTDLHSITESGKPLSKSNTVNLLFHAPQQNAAALELRSGHYIFESKL
ncbi:MAG: glycoside hydrolase family 78 protein [Phycisphaerales bacterium]|nr:glycoside hydrolase family 78 protein [Phycisphaerales bacterium]